MQIPARRRFRHCGPPPHLVCCTVHKREEGKDMKRLSTALAATGLLALAACGGRAANNSAAVLDNSTNDVYDVAPDSLTLNDTGNAGNASSSSNTSSSSNASRSAHHSTSNASGNSH
jgi:hypothetical protein